MSIARKPGQSSNNIETIIRQAARKYGIDENHFVHIATCESRLKPDVVNYNYYETHDGIRYYPAGLFQHLSYYWPDRAAKYGYAGQSVTDPIANANVTAGMFRDGLSSLWECK